MPGCCLRWDSALSLQPPEVTSVGDDVPLLMEEESQDVNNLRDTYHELKTQLHSLVSEVCLYSHHIPWCSCTDKRFELALALKEQKDHVIV